jgi:phosphoenolpyruvate phosphomutase
MAAHNPLGARLVEEAGFDAVWGSGFELSASFGLPDASLITMSDQLEMTRRMVEAVGIPVIADFDTGFGNAINVDHAVRRYAAAGIAALVIEDKTYPKDTSLREGGRQQLVRIAEFQGKIEAAVAAGGEQGIVVIARVEALIAGFGLDEATTRAAAYCEAGADMILIHSKSKTPDEIEAFVARWDGRRPIAIVPTAYPQFDEARAAATGKIGLVIYGNHGLRAAVAAMRATFKRIRTDHSAAAADKQIATVNEIMELQGDAAMRELEKRFLR